MISRFPTFRIIAYATTVLIGLTGSLLAGRPEPAVLVTPFAVVLVVTLTGRPPALPNLAVRTDGERFVEGDQAEIRYTVDVAEAELAPQLPDGVVVVATRPAGDGVAVTIAFDTWGVFDVGRVAVRAFDPLRGWVAEATLHAPCKLRVHPRTDRLPKQVVSAMDLQPFVGHHRSRARGDGFEFADLRPYHPGDRARAVNWRASSRRRTLWVNERHPDRSSDVVLLLDTFGADRPSRLASLELAVRAIAAVAEVYGGTHDRVGLLTFGGHLRWLAPSGGRLQVTRVVDALLDAEILLTDVWGEVGRVPVGAIPPKSLLLAVTPMQSDTSVDTLIDLRSRGFDVAVISVAAEEGDTAGHNAVALGRRLDALLRDARRLRLERLGIAVSSATHSLAASMREVDECRRRMPRVRV